MKRSQASVIFAAAIAIAVPTGLGAQIAEAAPSGTAISTADDLKAMEKNPSGSYYLAKDITVPGNLRLFKNSSKPFKGTLDGNGHKLSGYKYTASSFTDGVALFGNARSATFKNLAVSGVSIQMTSGGSAAGLVANTTGCTFENVATSGSITIKNEDDENQDLCNAAGLVLSENGTGAFKNCTNGIKINLTHTGESAPSASGIANTVMKGTLSGCTNKGSISITHTPNSNWGSGQCNAAGIIAFYDGNKAITGCKNTASISITGKASGSRAYEFAPTVAGIAVTSYSSVVSCSNSGKLLVANNTADNNGSSIAGIACDVERGGKVSKCSNSGAISYTGKRAGGTATISIAGVTNAAVVEQSYNKGKVSVNSKVPADAGGVASWCTDMRNCYNTGAIVHKGTGNVGGLAGKASVVGGYVKGNYSTGKVSGSSSKKLYKGQLIGYYSGGYTVSKRNIYDNYHTASGKAYGGADYTWKPWLATATKVSAITAKSCPKLSSKHWTYSSKHKRLVLKANKEK